MGGCRPPPPARIHDFVVADLSLAEAGRHQLRLAENEMPGLMALREGSVRSSRWPAPASPARCT
jgi:hypothetical protein